ncbi:unnamed protein product [Sphagnum balticum]
MEEDIVYRSREIVDKKLDRQSNQPTSNAHAAKPHDPTSRQEAAKPPVSSRTAGAQEGMALLSRVVGRFGRPGFWKYGAGGADPGVWGLSVRGCVSLSPRPLCSGWRYGYAP